MGERAERIHRTRPRTICPSQNFPAISLLRRPPSFACHPETFLYTRLWVPTLARACNKSDSCVPHAQDRAYLFGFSCRSDKRCGVAHHFATWRTWEVVVRRAAQRRSQWITFEMETMKRVRRSDEFTAGDRNPANSVAFLEATLKASEFIARRTVHSNRSCASAGARPNWGAIPCVTIVYTL